MVMADHISQEGILDHIMAVSLLDCSALCISSSCKAFNYANGDTAGGHACQLLSQTAMSPQSLTFRKGFTYYEISPNDI